MKNKLIISVTFLSTLCALVGCDKPRENPKIYDKTKYVNQFTYFVSDEFINKTYYIYENNDKKVTIETYLHQHETDPSVFKLGFRTIEEYDDNYRLISHSSYTYDTNDGTYLCDKSTYTYNSMGLVATMSEYVSSTQYQEDELSRTYFYTYDNEGRIIQELEKNSDGVERRKYEYIYNVNGFDKNFYELDEDSENIKSTVNTTVTINLVNNTKTITEKYKKLNYSPVDEFKKITDYNDKNQVIKRRENGHLYTFEYNENGDITLECDYSLKAEWGPEEYGYVTRKENSYDNNGYLLSALERSINDEISYEYVNWRTTYVTGVNGFVVLEVNYIEDTDEIESYCSYSISDERNKVNPNISKEAAGVGTYSLVLYSEL